MGAPVANERINASEPDLPERKGDRTRASWVNQPGEPDGMVLPWLMTMPSPREDIKIGNIGARGDEKLERAQHDRVAENVTPAAQLTAMAEGPSSASPAPLITGNDNTVPPSNASKPAVIAPWLSTTPRLAEHDIGNFHAAPESAAERLSENSDPSVPELPSPTAETKSKEEIANVEVPLRPAETYVAPEAHIETDGNSHAALYWETAKSWGGHLNGADDRGVWLRANEPILEEVASTETQLERDWIRAVSVVPSADPSPSGIERSKRPDVAVLTQRSRKGSLTLLAATFFIASALCIWVAGLRPFSNLPRQSEIPPSLASVSTKEAPVGMEAQYVQKSSGATGTSSQPPVPSSGPESSGGAEIIVATQPSRDVPSRSPATSPTLAATPENDSGLENNVPLAPSEEIARPAHTPQHVGAPLAWQSYEVPEFGTRVQIPAGIFIPAGKPRQGSGQRFERADGRAVLSIYSRPNKMGESPATYLKQNLRVDRSALDYQRIARSFFAISLEQDGVILYSRCNFSSRASAAIHCFDLTYPQEEKRSWDAVVTRISLSLRPLEG
jgi:hypothetical protein